VATHICEAASNYLDSDAVFAVKPSLLREFVRRSPDDPAPPPVSSAIDTQSKTTSF
jgi:hydroxyquinol 1,2-dioxygenase